MKNKYLNCWFVAVIAVMALALLGYSLTACTAPITQVEPQAVVSNRPLTPYLCSLETEVDADAWFLLVDLSDRVNYPHVRTDRIILKSIRIAGDLSDAKHWHWQVGVVTAVDAAGTDVEWLMGGARNRLAQFDERWELPEHGLSLEVINGTVDSLATNMVTTTVEITTGTYLSTCLTISGTLPGVGDLILHLDEISDTATLDFFITTGYDTE